MAAVSGAAKTICKNGSFSTDSSNYYSGFSDENTTSTTHHHHPQIMVAQIQLLDIPDLMIKEYRDKVGDGFIIIILILNLKSLFYPLPIDS